MINSNEWLQNVSQKLAANGYSSVAPEKYQAQGFKYSAQRSRFELSKFGMAESFFTFAEIPNLTKEILMQFSTTALQLANNNKKVSLPNGIFVATFSYNVAITANLNPQLAEHVRQSDLIKHWSAFELPIVFDVANGVLHYYEKTPLWGAAYYNGFRKEIKSNLT